MSCRAKVEKSFGYRQIHNLSVIEFLSKFYADSRAFDVKPVLYNDNFFN